MLPLVTICSCVEYAASVMDDLSSRSTEMTMSLRSSSRDVLSCRTWNLMVTVPFSHSMPSGHASDTPSSFLPEEKTMQNCASNADSYRYPFRSGAFTLIFASSSSLSEYSRSSAYTWRLPESTSRPPAMGSMVAEAAGRRKRSNLLSLHEAAHTSSRTWDCTRTCAGQPGLRLMAVGVGETPRNSTSHDTSVNPIADQ